MTALEIAKDILDHPGMLVAEKQWRPALQALYDYTVEAETRAYEAGFAAAMKDER